jgi:hypothetical protein
MNHTIATRLAKAEPDPNLVVAQNELKYVLSEIDELIAQGSIDKAEALMEKVESKLRTTKKPVTCDADCEDDDWCGPGGPDDDDDEDDKSSRVKKLGPRMTKPRYPGDASHEGLHYPEDDLTDAMGANRQVEQPEISFHAGGRTRFDDHVDEVKSRDGVSHLEAMRRARRERPGLFRSSQGRATITKSSSSTYESLVAEQMAKGCNEEVASQRVMQQYGAAAFASSPSPFAKRAESAESRLQDRAYEIAGATGLPMEVALRKARLEQPYLVQAMNT